MKLIKLKELEEEKIALNEKNKITTADKQRLKQIEEDMKPLKTFLEDAQKQRDAIKEEISTYVFSFLLFHC